MHTVVVLALDGVIAFDLATPIEIFERVMLADGSRAYEVLVAGLERSVEAGPVSLSVPYGLERLLEADTIIVPGRSDPSTPPEVRVLEALREAAAGGARIASICVGALDLAATGLLDGLDATTHWKAVRLLAARHPDVRVDAGALYVDNGQLLCSAGAAAGIDLCLHLVERDHGSAAAAEAARTAVVPLTREAGQAQYIREDDLGITGLTATLRWIDQHAHEPVTVADIARTAAVSTRTLNRRFAEEVGVSPSAWLIRARVRRAQLLLEATDWTIDQIAAVSGHGTSTNLRARFSAVLGTSPSRYRAALGHRDSSRARPAELGPAASGTRVGKRQPVLDRSEPTRVPD